MKHIAILGANGRLGNEAMQAFYNAGYRVTAVTRSGHVRNAPKGVRKAAADAMNLRQLKKAVRGAQFIFNGLNPPYSSWLHVAMPMARNVMEAARSTRAVHLYPANVYNYGAEIPPLCTPETAMQASGVKGKVRIETEKLFALAAQRYRLQTLIIRAGDGYGGSGRGGWFDQTLVEKRGAGLFVYPGPPDVVHTWAYLPDLARAFVALAEQAAQRDCYEDLLYAGHALSGAELQKLVEQACGRELRCIAMPWRLIRWGSLLVPAWREINETAYLWSRPHRLQDERMVAITRALAPLAPAQAVYSALSELDKV